MGCIFAKLPAPAEAEAAAVVATDGGNIQRNSNNNNLFVSPKDRASASTRKTNLSARKFENNVSSNRFVVEPNGGLEEVKETIKVKTKHNGNHAEGEVRERRKEKPNSRLSNPPKHLHGEQVAAGWPAWLFAVAGEAIKGSIPRRADTFEKLDKIGARDVTFEIACCRVCHSNLHQLRNEWKNS